MATYADYTTVDAVRGTWLSSTETVRDTVIAELIRSVSREIDAIGCRSYFPRIETRYYDTPRGDMLVLDDDLLSVTTLTNGSGGALTTGQYKLYPLNESAKDSIRIMQSSGHAWQADSGGDTYGAVSVEGVWGFHLRYGSAWLDTGATLAAAITTTSATSFTCTTGKLKAGNLIQVDTEWMHVSNVATAASDTVTVIRGVNGSTAATHLISTAISRYTFDEVEMVARLASAAYYRLRTNPVGDVVQVGDMTFNKPKDVGRYIWQRLSALEIIRENFG